MVLEYLLYYIFIISSPIHLLYNYSTIILSHFLDTKQLLNNILLLAYNTNMGIRMCLSGTRCLSTDCCFSELVQ